MARAKKEKALVQALIILYKKLTSSKEIDVLTRTLGDRGDDDFEHRVKGLCHRIDEDGSGFIDAEEMAQAFRTLGLVRSTEKSVLAMMKTFGVSSDGEISPDMFYIVCKGFAASANIFSGHEELEDLTHYQLITLYNHNWRKDMSSQGGQNAGTNGNAITRTDGSQPAPASIFDSFSRTSSGWRSTSHLFSRKKARRPLSDTDMRLWVMQKAYKMVRQKRLTIPTIRWDGSTEEERIALERIGAVFRPFKVEYWYFEPCFILIQKLIMTTVLTFLLYGSSTQIAVGFLILWASMTYVLVAQPYGEAAVNGMSVYSYSCQAITLFYGLTSVTEEAMGGQPESEFLPWFIFVLDLSVVAYPIKIMLGRVSLRDIASRVLFALFPKRMMRSAAKHQGSANDIETGGEIQRGVPARGSVADAMRRDTDTDVALGPIGDYKERETSSRRDVADVGVDMRMLSPFSVRRGDAKGLESQNDGPKTPKTSLPQGLCRSAALQKLLDEAKISAFSSYLSDPGSPHNGINGDSNTGVNGNGASAAGLDDGEAGLVGEIVCDTPQLHDYPVSDQGYGEADLAHGNRESSVSHYNGDGHVACNGDAHVDCNLWKQDDTNGPDGDGEEKVEEQAEEHTDGDGPASQA